MSAVTKELLHAAVIEAAEDPAFFCRFFLPHWFPTPLPPLHLGMLALVTRKVGWLAKYPDAHEFLFDHFRYMSDPNDPTSEPLPIFQPTGDGRIRMVAGVNNNFIIPRGFSKTTLLNAVNLSEAVTDGTTFCVYISESSGHAETQLGNIRNELETNANLRAAYGDVVPTRSDSEKWTADQLQLKNGAVLVAKGRGSQVRGTNFRGRRPNRILLDDVEDRESVSTALQREKTVEWFYGSVMPAGNEMSGAVGSEQQQEPLQITVLGTLLGAETLITKVAEDITFNTVRFGAVLENGEMLWPYKMSKSDYAFKRKQYTLLGQLSSFTLEFDSTVRVAEDAIFKASDVQIYIPVQRSDLVQVGQALDPAISDQPGRDHTALVVAGRHQNGSIWILDEWGGLGKTPREKVDMFFEMQARWQCQKNGIEAQQYQKALIFLMREEMARRRLFFEITPIVQGSHVRKDDRIVGVLAPRYSNGYIRHRKRFPNLEQNLLDWPNGKKDYPDAAAMALTLLGETAMLASPANIVLQDEYEPLEKQLPPLYGTGPFIFQGGVDPHKGRYG